LCKRSEYYKPISQILVCDKYYNIAIDIAQINNNSSISLNNTGSINNILEGFHYNTSVLDIFYTTNTNIRTSRKTCIDADGNNISLA
jgi:hypothetical protein